MKVNHLGSFKNVLQPHPDSPYIKGTNTRSGPAHVSSHVKNTQSTQCTPI